MALVPLVSSALSILWSSLIFGGIIHELVLISKVDHLLLIKKLLLDILTSQVFVSVLLGVISCHPRVDQRFLNIDSLHLLMPLSSSVFST